jgi:hypothetical protein
MTFSEAVTKLGFHLASEVFRRAGTYDGIPFSEWLKVAQTAFTSDGRKARHFLLPFDGEQGRRYEEEASVAALRQLQAKAKTFEDHHVILREAMSMGFNHNHVDPDPWPSEVLKLGELASTFDQCVIVYDYVQSGCYDGLGVNMKYDFSARYKTLREVILERASNHAKSLAEWRWVTDHLPTFTHGSQWVRAVEAMEPLCSTLDEWLEFAKVVLPAGSIGKPYAERATEKIVELTLQEVAV